MQIRLDPDIYAVIAAMISPDASNPAYANRPTNYTVNRLIESSPAFVEAKKQVEAKMAKKR